MAMHSDYVLHVLEIILYTLANIGTISLLHYYKKIVI